MYGEIYLITDLQKTKCYVGSTKNDRFHRFEEHWSSRFQKPDKFHLWLKTQSKENLETSRLDIADDPKSLKLIERQYIEQYRETWGLDCLNSTTSLGGPGVLEGEDNPMALFINEEADIIRDTYQQTPNMNEIANLWNVSPQTIRLIIYNETYTDPDYIPPTREEVLANMARNTWLTRKKNDPKAQLAFDIRLFAQEHQEWKGSQIAQQFDIDGKYCRQVLRNKLWEDPTWDHKTWTFRS